MVSPPGSVKLLDALVGKPAFLEHAVVDPVEGAGAKADGAPEVAFHLLALADLGLEVAEVRTHPLGGVAGLLHLVPGVFQLRLGVAPASAGLLERLPALG